jgi:hypothetical protein
MQVNQTRWLAVTSIKGFDAESYRTSLGRRRGVANPYLCCKDSVSLVLCKLEYWPALAFVGAGRRCRSKRMTDTETRPF